MITILTNPAYIEKFIIEFSINDYRSFPGYDGNSYFIFHEDDFDLLLLAMDDNSYDIVDMSVFLK